MMLLFYINGFRTYFNNLLINSGKIRWESTDAQKGLFALIQFRYWNENSENKISIVKDNDFISSL